MTPANHRLFSWENLLDQLRLEFGSAIDYRCSPEWQIMPRVMPDEQLHLVQQGELEYTIGGEVYHARPRQVVFCPPEIRWSVRRTSTTLIRLTVIHFQARFPGGRRYLEVLGFNPVLRPTPSTWHDLRRIGSRLSAIYSQKPPGHSLKATALLYEFFHAFYWLHGTVAPVGADGERVLKVVEYLRRNMSRKITLKSLERMVGLSANHLATLFRNQTGSSPIDYLIRLRLEEAGRLLVLRQHRVGEIARMVGYEDPAYFNRLFHKHMGIAPGRYRTRRSALI